MTATYKQMFRVGLLLVSFMLFFFPYEYAVGRTVYLLWKGLLCLVSLGYTVAALASPRRISLCWVLFLLFYVDYYLISGLISQTDVNYVNLAFRFAEGVGFASLCEFALQRNAKEAAWAFAGAALIMCAIHFGSYLMFKDITGGMRHGYIEFDGKTTKQNWYFLTYDNASIFYFLPLVGVLWFLAFEGSRKVKILSVVVTVFALYMFFERKSATAMATMLVFLVGVVLALIDARTGALSRSYVGKHLFSLPSAVIFGFLATIAVLFVAGNEVFSAISALFSKSVSFSGRDRIWGLSLDWIAQSPLLGYGIEDSVTSVEKIAQTHCHNIFLQLLYTGGVVSLILFAAALFSCSKVGKRLVGKVPAAHDTLNAGDCGRATGAGQRRNAAGDCAVDQCSGQRRNAAKDCAVDRYSGPRRIILFFSVFAYFVACSMDWEVYYVIPLFLFYLFATEGRVPCVARRRRKYPFARMTEKESDAGESW